MITLQGDYIAFTADSSTMTLIDHTTAGSVSSASTLALGGTAGSCDFSADGQYIAVVKENDSISLVDHTTAGSLSLATNFTIDELHQRGVAFSPD